MRPRAPDTPSTIGAPMRGWLIALAVVVAAVAGAYWFLTGGSPGREPVGWIAEEPIAHKGQWSDGATRPENSLAAFRLAAGNGHPIELDVQLSSDGRVVVFHDYDLERMTGESGKLAERTAAELKQLRLSGGAETIPELSEVLALVNDSVPLFVEIKNEGSVGDLEDAVARDLSAYEGRAAVMSFNPNSLARVAEQAPELPRGQLSSLFRGEDLASYKKFALRYLLMNWTSKPDFIAFDIAGAPNSTVEIQKRRGRPLLGWTATTAEERASAEKYCDAVICDEAALP